MIPDTASPIAQMAIEYSFPTWLVDRWVKRFGMDEARELCRVQDVPPALDIRLDPRRITRDCFIRELEEQGVKCSALPHSTVGVSVSGCGNVSELPLFSQGAFQIQDEAAQLVGLLPDVKPGMRILDACAAPGGKTCHLAQRLEGKGEILATDLYDHRLERLEDEARRLKLSDVISTQARDVSLPLDVPAESFDLILADLPCTGLGTTNRHPEIRYRRSREDPARMAAVQAAILKNLARYVRKGGQLVYSVCSMEPEEGREQVAYIESLGFRLVPPSDQCGVDWGSVRDGESLAIATYPHRHGCDGFFGTRFERI